MKPSKPHIRSEPASPPTSPKAAVLDTAGTEELTASVKATTPEELRDKKWKDGLAKARANRPTLLDAFGFNRK